MKIISILVLFLIVCAFASANHHHHECNGVACPSGSICLKKFGICSCIEIPKCHDVDLSISTVSTWSYDGGKTMYTQYDVKITNHLDVDIKEIYIGTDSTFTLKDNDTHNLWNMDRCSDNELTLSKYQPSINKNASYVFGFILCGSTKPNLSILSVTY